MIVKEFSIRLNVLAWYAFSVANINKGKTKIFINGLRFDITKDMLTRDNPPKLNLMH